MNASLSCREWLLVSTAAAVSGVAAAAAVTLAHSRKESAFGGVASAGNAVPAPRKRMSFWKCLTRLLGSSDCCAAADVFDSKGGLGEKSDGDAYLKPRPEIDEEERLPLVNSSKDHILGDPIICNVRGNADASDPSKRKSYLSWDDYFMAIAFLSAERSKDPNRQVGACLVSQDRVILGELRFLCWFSVAWKGLVTMVFLGDVLMMSFHGPRCRQMGIHCKPSIPMSAMQR
eukprot:c21514_g1_i1 orf=825-1517(-)